MVLLQPVLPKKEQVVNFFVIYILLKFMQAFSQFAQTKVNFVHNRRTKSRRNVVCMG